MNNDGDAKIDFDTAATEEPSGGGDATAGSAQPTGPAILQEVVDPAAYKKVLAENRDLQDRLARKQAELENMRKRMQREKEDFLQHANAELVRSLLPTLDGFDRALKHRDAGVPAQFYEGLELIYRQMMGVLERTGLAVVETQGKIFDPHYHQAVETVESAEHRDHEIIEELQRGYKLKQKLLRPAIVKVAVAPKSEKGL